MGKKMKSGGLEGEKGTVYNILLFYEFQKLYTVVESALILR